jgi:hypothetical protein
MSSINGISSTPYTPPATPVSKPPAPEPKVPLPQDTVHLSSAALGDADHDGDSK